MSPIPDDFRPFEPWRVCGKCEELADTDALGCGADYSIEYLSCPVCGDKWEHIHDSDCSCDDCESSDDCVADGFL